MCLLCSLIRSTGSAPTWPGSRRAWLADAPASAAALVCGSGKQEAGQPAHLHTRAQVLCSPHQQVAGVAVRVVQAQVQDADAVHVGHAELRGAQVAGVPRVRHEALQAGQLWRRQACSLARVSARPAAASRLCRLQGAGWRSEVGAKSRA